MKKLIAILTTLFTFKRKVTDLYDYDYDYAEQTVEQRLDLIERNLNSLWSVIQCQQNNALDLTSRGLTLKQEQRLTDIVAGLIAAKRQINQIIEKR